GRKADGGDAEKGESMRRLLFALFTMTGCLALTGGAQAGVRLSFGIGVPIYRPYHRVYVAPAPLYVRPAVVVPVYVAPAPVYYQPVQMAQPVYVAPAPQAAAPAYQGLPAQPTPVVPPPAPEHR